MPCDMQNIKLIEYKTFTPCYLNGDANPQPQILLSSPPAGQTALRVLDLTRIRILLLLTSTPANGSTDLGLIGRVE